MTKKRQEEENIKDDITLDLYELCEEDEGEIEDEEEIEDEPIEDEEEIEDEPIEDEAEARSDKDELKAYYSNLI